MIKKRAKMNGKTDIPALASIIAGCDLFITGDSGPMHITAEEVIAAAEKAASFSKNPTSGV